MSPTALRVGRYRLFFLAREEEWPHVHVASPDGEAKCWLEPTVEWAKGHGLDDREREQILRIVMICEVKELIVLLLLQKVFEGAVELYRK